MALKYVSAAKPTQYADKLHEVQQELSKLDKKMKLLREEEKQLQKFLLKFSHQQSFSYDGADGYKKIVKVSHVERMILDQEKVRKLLKAKTPYKKNAWDAVRVDWIYSK